MTPSGQQPSNRDSAGHHWRRYLIWYVAVLFVCCGLVGSFNAIVDPHGRLLFIDSPGFNQAKVTLKRNSRKDKAAALRQCGFSRLVAGTSRAEMALAMDQPPLDGPTAYNAALRGASMYEIRRIVEYAMQQHELEELYLGLDFVSFNANLIYEEDFDESPLAESVSPASFGRYLFSLQTMRESVFTLRVNRRGSPPLCDDKGQHRSLRERKEARLAFDIILRRYATGPYTRHVPGAIHSQHLAELLRELTEAGVIVHAFIPPAHVLHLELLAEMGKLDEYEAWKREITEIFATINRDLPSSRQAALWDFSGYNGITTEKVPLPDNDDPYMRWYSDSSHARPVVGQMMIDRMSGEAIRDPVSGDVFGVLLTPDSVNDVIRQARRGSVRYRNENQQEIQRLQEMLRENL